MKNKWKVGITMLVILCTVVSASAFAASPVTEIEFTPDAIISVADKSASMIEEYVQDVEQRNEELISNNLENISATITFSDYLSFQEFGEYVEAYGIEILQLQARGMMDDGTRVSIFSRTDKGLEETERLLQNEAVQGSFEFVGITGVNARVSSEELSAINDDSRTYLADTSGNAEPVQNIAMTAALGNEVQESWFPQSLAWDLEDIGVLR